METKIMQRKLNAYQQVLNQSKQENISYRIFDSIEKYIKDGTNQEYSKLIRTKMLSTGHYLCLTALEYLSNNIPKEIEDSILILINGIAQRIKMEVKKEFSQDFSQAYKALEELKKITK
tara:strand:+ start:641 stop:997 length:357 start_codon:yes stop_codon:yes gene_type:complete